MTDLEVEPVPEEQREILKKASHEATLALKTLVEAYEPAVALNAINYVHVHATLYFSKKFGVDPLKLGEMESAVFMAGVLEFSKDEIEKGVYDEG